MELLQNFTPKNVYQSKIHCISFCPSSAKAELAHLLCGCTIVIIIAVVLFSPGPLCPPDVLVDKDMKATCQSISQRKLEQLSGITSASGKYY